MGRGSATQSPQYLGVTPDSPRDVPPFPRAFHGASGLPAMPNLARPLPPVSGLPTAVNLLKLAGGANGASQTWNGEYSAGTLYLVLAGHAPHSACQTDEFRPSLGSCACSRSAACWINGQAARSQQLAARFATFSPWDFLYVYMCIITRISRVCVPSNFTILSICGACFSGHCVHFW